MKTDRGAADARAGARRLLNSDTARWQHVVGVAEAAGRAAAAVSDDDVQTLLAAAWLHDIGYSDQVADTGFHSLDGARYLRAAGVPDRVCSLVANHTHAWVEAESRGLAEALATEFPPERSPVADALTFADLTTGPDGAPVSVETRLAEILSRYEPGHLVHESIRRASPDLIATVRRVESRLAAATQPR